MQMGQMMGIYERTDWDANIPRNICFMHIKVRMDPWMPLLVGFMLRLDNGDRIWIQCRYERVHKVCTKCGLIDHTRAQCTYLMEDVEQLLHHQRLFIQNQFQVHYGFHPVEPHFVNEIRAFYNRPQRRNTQIRFGPLTRDTGYRHKQYQQGGAPHHNKPPCQTWKKMAPKESKRLLSHQHLTCTNQQIIYIDATHPDPSDSEPHSFNEINPNWA